MEKFARSFFSMRMMAIGMLVFLISIATATFLESAYDIQTARLLVYNATWFEGVLIYLGINLIANIFRYNMFQREKIAMLMFHLSFIVMLIGAGITRYISFEGLMIIHEGEQADFIYSSEPHLWMKINDGEKQYTYSELKYMSEIASNDFSIDVDFPGHKTPISIDYVRFEKNQIDSLVEHDSIQGSAFEFVSNGMKSNYVFKNEFLMVGDIAISYEKKNAMPGIEVFLKGNKTMLKTQFPMRSVSMAMLQRPGQEVPDSLYNVIPVDTLVPLESATLYQVQDQQFVFKGVKKHVKKMHLPSKNKNEGSDYLVVKVTDGKMSKIVSLEGGKDAIPEHNVFEFNGLVYELEYGSMRIGLPFAVACRDFQLDRYPGSESPSSFASEVTIIDTINNYTRDQRIFMNNVMDYGGYRFFQSSYEPDESGTRLSVNHDWWGTNISYLGYLMMGIGMIFSLIAPGGRFRELNQLLKKSREKRKKIASVLIFGALLNFGAFAETPDSLMHEDHSGHDHAQHDHSQHEKQVSRPKIKPTFKVMTEEHSDELASLLVQDNRGRIIPMHSMCDQLLRKVYRSNTYKEYNAVQTIMSMHMHPDYWMEEPVIYVSSKSNLREKLKAKNGLVSFRDLVDKNGDFILLSDYQKAHQRLESKRGEYDKQLIKLAEKFEVAQSIFSWRFMNIVPVPNDPNNKWYSPLNLSILEKDTSGIKKSIRYLAALDSASSNLKSFDKATEALNVVKKFQYDIAKNVVPSPSIVNMEISYNKMGIFKNSYRSYLLLGTIALLIFFVKIFITPSDKVNKIFKRISFVITALLIVIFVYHGAGLTMRWMISGHAPWSNGYEAVVFIAWATMLFGLIFSRKNAVILASAAILASLMIFVTEMNLMDPEITPLQPVLKSYWLMIHVAIITGSYGPLGISCILGILNLVLYVFRNKKNGEIFTININELTYVSEMTMTVGLFMLTIGTFLGGIWANESWGRYWGWDPKETWALVAVLVYAVILHLRYIPALKSKFLFNAVSMWGYTAVLFTFFGVNFYLVGLHSYAQGEGLGKIPNGIIIAVLLFLGFTVLAAIRNKKYKKYLEEKHLK